MTRTLEIVERLERLSKEALKRIESIDWTSQGWIMICEACNKNKATQLHHKFSQTKWAKKLYGVSIHDGKNLQHVCADCHTSHASPFLIHWSEQEFCDAMGFKPRSKVGRMKWLQRILLKIKSARG